MLGIAPALAGTQELVTVDGLRLFDMENVRAEYSAAHVQSSIPVGRSEWRTTLDLENAQVIYTQDSGRMLNALWSRTPLAFSTRSSIGHWNWTTTAMLGPPQEYGGSFRLAWRGAYLLGVRQHSSPLSLSWQDPIFPEDIGRLSFRWQTLRSSLALGHNLQGKRGSLSLHGTLHWTEAPALRDGYQLRDSTIALGLRLHGLLNGSNWRYSGQLATSSAFSQWQGLRHQDNDTKRFALIRTGMDQWSTRHTWSTPTYECGLYGSWTRLRLHPTNSLRTGETFAANRLFSSDLAGTFAHAFYRRTYQAQGEGELWMAQWQGQWRPATVFLSWKPRLGGQLLLPHARADFPVRETTQSLIYETSRTYRWSGQATLLLGQVRLGASRKLLEGMDIEAELGQWFPLAGRSSLAWRQEDATPSTHATVARQSPSAAWNLLEDGISLHLALRGCF